MEDMEDTGERVMGMEGMENTEKKITDMGRV